MMCSPGKLRKPCHDAAIANTDAPPLVIHKALAGVKRNAPFDLIRFPEDSARFVDDDGLIHISHDDVIWQRL